jgi:membrane associated rhomboid family serine protease
VIIPIGDDNRDRLSRPVVNWLLILANIAVFVFLQHWGQDLRFTYAYSTVPAEILSGKDVVTNDRVFTDPYTGEQVRQPGLQPTPIPVYLTLITSMFMHGGIAHILGNMLYLFIFGDNVEDRLGRGRYLVFYLFCGVLAGLAHVYASTLAGQGADTPTLGASGAISGVLGAYIVLFPRKRVRVIMLRILMSVPAIVVIGVWFVFQLVSGLGYLGGSGGGVAYGAHVGGFVAGALFVKLFAAGAGRRRAYR